MPLFNSAVSNNTLGNGPWREEILFIGDLLRKGSDISPMESNEEMARDRVIAMRSAAKNGKLRREAWEPMICQLICDGYLRRGHLLGAISAEALRELDFTAAELLDAGFALFELRQVATASPHPPRPVRSPRVCAPRARAPTACAPTACAPPACKPRNCKPRNCKPPTCKPPTCKPHPPAPVRRTVERSSHAGPFVLLCTALRAGSPSTGCGRQASRRPS